MPTYLLAITCTVVVLCLNGCEEVHVENSLEQSLLLALLLSSKLSGRTCSSGRSESRCRRNASSGGKSDGVLHLWFNWWNYGTELVVFHAFTMFSLSLTVVLRQKRRTQIEDTLLKCVCLREWWWIISEPPLHSSTADPEVNKKTKKREREEKRQFSSRCTRAFLFAIMTHRTVSSQNHQHRTPTDAETILKNKFQCKYFFAIHPWATCHIFNLPFKSNWRTVQSLNTTRP